MGMNVAFRADSSAAMGSGHLLRCLTLAETLQKEGAHIRFICRDHPGNMISSLHQKGIEVLTLPGGQTNESGAYADWLGAPHATDAEESIRALGNFTPDWLVVDHYAIDARWERILRPHVGRIMVIDDFALRQHDCDLLLDQNFRTESAGNPYTHSVPLHAKTLLGPSYALLRPEFALARSRRKHRDGTVRRILLCFGGSDPQQHTLATLLALRPHAEHLHRIDVVVGPANQNHEAIAKACECIPNIIVHHPAENMAELLSMADLAIGAGGTMNLERACLGVPTIAFGIAENQRELLAALFEAGCAIGQESLPCADEQRIGMWINCALENPALLRGMSQRSASLVDGLGARRTAAALLTESTPLRNEMPAAVDVLCTDPRHPVRPYLEAWCSRHHGARLCTNSEELRGGDFLFLISCQELIGEPIRTRYRHSLVVHASDLPQGRGMSPHVWQILAGMNEITVSLLQAADPFDTGAIWAKRSFKLEGHELCDEINAALFAQEIALMDWALAHCDSLSPQEQVGTPTYYKRRTPDDCRIAPEKSLAEQFDLLRTADPARYPAFFDFRGCRFQITLSKQERIRE